MLFLSLFLGFFLSAPLRRRGSRAYADANRGTPWFARQLTASKSFASAHRVGTLTAANTPPQRRQRLAEPTRRQRKFEGLRAPEAPNPSRDRSPLRLASSTGATLAMSAAAPFEAARLMVKDAVTGAQALSSITLRGSIERIMETTGVHGYVLDALAWLPPEVVLVLDNVHIWFPLLTLFAFFFLGPAAAHQGGRVGNRAWLAFSTAVTVRQLVLWFVGLPPVKGMLLAVGLEIIPARRRRASRHRPAPSVGSAPSTCIAAKYEPVSNVPSAFSRSVHCPPRSCLNPFFSRPRQFKPTLPFKSASLTSRIRPNVFQKPRRGRGAAEGLP